MKKKYIYSGIIAILAVFLAIGFFWLNQNTASDSGIVLFVSETCPHCKNVEKFIEENKIEEKVSFVKKEVSNPKNIKDFTAKSKDCKIPAAEMGVPLLWSEGKCFVGDQDIINFFKEKAGLNQ